MNVMAELWIQVQERMVAEPRLIAAALLCLLLLLIMRMARRRKHALVGYALDAVLFMWTASDPFTVRNLLNGGVAILGRAGSGKTSWA